jgi:hypothetical protein
MRSGECYEPHKSYEPLKSGLRRVTEINDPQVAALFEGEQSDRVGILIEHIPDFSLKQKVHALLLLTDDEFTEFQARRIGGAEFALRQLSAKQSEMNNEDIIKAISQLRDASPRYEVEAQIRRRWHGNYPPQWDLDLEEDFRFQPEDGLLRLKEGKRLTYEEAIEFTRFENTRSWYRNVYFPQVTRLQNPLPLTLTTLIQLFRDNRNIYFDPKKPGTDISMENLLKVIHYYLNYEYDNEDNCKIHTATQRLAGTIKEFEDVITN